MKDCYWFRHDSNASRDLKLIKIRAIYDFWGIGIYWSLVEFLREQDNYKYEFSETNMQLLCEIIGCKDLIKFNNFITDSIKIKLFVCDEYFYSTSLIDRMTKWESCKNNAAKGKGITRKADGNTKPIESQTEANQKPNADIIEDKIIKEKSIEYIDRFPNFQTDKFKKTWMDYILLRKSNGRFMEAQEYGLVSKLNSLTKDEVEAIEIIQNSINAGYPDFYPLKNYNKQEDNTDKLLVYFLNGTSAKDWITVEQYNKNPKAYKVISNGNPAIQS